MPLPKRRHSRTRGRKRRTNWKIASPNVIECPHCHSPRLPHHVCTSCGYYNGRQILLAKEA
ncbi:MAG: 50S ribosomal protein L32 [Candidatus Zixiibacteriota bacterium]|nr:MAG: 50S ribosomal protein L32 [candidate division Zixibacteria bacterium]